MLRTSGWFPITVSKMARAYRKADHSEWTGFLDQGVWKTIERAEPHINISNLLILSIRWAKSEYKKLYMNKAQKTEDQCDAMEFSHDGEMTEIPFPVIDSKYEDIEIKEFLAKMESSLETREMNIFREIMDNETTLRELGKSIGISHERCRQLMEKAKEKALRILAKSKGMTPKECKAAHSRKELVEA